MGEGLDLVSSKGLSQAQQLPGSVIVWLGDWQGAEAAAKIQQLAISIASWQLVLTKTLGPMELILHRCETCCVQKGKQELH